MYNKKYKDAAQSFEVATWVSPDAPNPYYNLASAYAQDGQKRRALEALKKAVEKGFANAARIQADKELEPLREEAEFKKIIEDLSKKP
jgi:tetratricopeptide (TPR) repeat protein